MSDKKQIFRTWEEFREFVEKPKKTFCDMIDEQIADEDKAVKEYQEIIKKLPEHERKEEGWLEDILKQEVLHKETLEKIKGRLCYKKRV